MLKGNLVKLLIYGMCGPQLSADIEIYTKVRHWKQEAQGAVLMI